MSAVAVPNERCRCDRCICRLAPDVSADVWSLLGASGMSIALMKWDTSIPLEAEKVRRPLHFRSGILPLPALARGAEPNWPADGQGGPEHALPRRSGGAGACHCLKQSPSVQGHRGSSGDGPQAFLNRSCLQMPITCHDATRGLLDILADLLCLMVVLWITFVGTQQSLAFLSLILRITYAWTLARLVYR